MFTKIARRIALSVVLLCVAASAQAPSSNSAQRLFTNPKFQAAADFIAADHDRFVREIIQITEIEAPPFKEEKRAKAYAEMMRQAGLGDVEIDAEGNVIGLRKGTGNGPLIAIAAHLDTVFPEGTNVKVRRQGTKLYGPGVGDDSRALAVLLAMQRALDVAMIQTASDILFVGNVGEEGPGDLRGNDITRAGVGSKRYRVVFRGPGGHSFGSFGLVSPAYALGNAIAKLSKMQVPSRPKTTFNVGVIGGGTSVNSIPFESWMDVDIRSETKEELNKAVENFTRLMREAVEEENHARSTSQGRIDVDVKQIGDRPFGDIPISAPIVQTASAVIKAFGLDPTYGMSSTDSNIPLSMGIPAITLETTAGRNNA